MTRDQLIAIIYRTHAEPYGEHITPALAQQLTICAGLAADELLAERGKQATVDHVHRIREIAATPTTTRPPLKERLAQRKAG